MMMKNKVKQWLLALTYIICVLGLGTTTYASTYQPQSFKGIVIPGQKPQEDYKDKLEKTSNQFLQDVSPFFNNAINILFTIMFLWGVWKMVYALITKQGRVMKASTAVLISTPLVLISIRVMFIIMLSSNISNTPTLGEDIITLLTKVGYLTSVGLLTLTLFNRFVFKLIHHPEFQRRSKIFFGISIILIVLTAVIPGILAGI